MTDASAGDRPPLKAATNSSPAPSPALPPSVAARQRVPYRNSSQQDASPDLRRRASLFSISSSIGDATQSLTDEIINPRTGGKRQDIEDESDLSHWHSSPLAFAILPAVGGLIFKNGSAFISDILLLGLAAVFMNWSIRLPWDWYYSAQAFAREVELVHNGAGDDPDDETAVKTPSSTESSPKRELGSQTENVPEPLAQNLPKREEAVTALRQQELLALGATFAFPALAAYLLHVIRAQLSASSTSLVSDYNLSIFLLAAEVRPVRQVIRLITNRTLHLQRIATGVDDPSSSSVGEKNHTLDGLCSRIADLEIKLSENTIMPATMTVAQKGDISDLSMEMRKRYEPRVEGLERAMRRYEKRMAALSAQTDERLQSLELRLRESLSLAAIAAEYAQNRGIVTKMFDWMYAMIALPLRLLWNVCTWPLGALGELYRKTQILLLGSASPGSSAKLSRSGRHEYSNGTGRDDKPRDKAIMRKVVR